MWRETDLSQSTLCEQSCSCLSTVFVGKAARGMETSKNKALEKKARGKINKGSGQFSEETKGNP